jgi:hypothetical protein
MIMRPNRRGSRSLRSISSSNGCLVRRTVCPEKRLNVFGGVELGEPFGIGRGRPPQPNRERLDAH